MPRTPEVCPTAFCPLSQLSNTVSSSSPIPLSASDRLPPASHQLPPASNRLLPAFRRLPSAVRRLPLAVCILLLLVTHHSSLITVHAQGATATLSGSVVDPNGAVIPGVNVAVINLSQGFQRTTTTNSEGIFVVPLLPPANYTVKAEHQGFTTAEVRDVVLNVNDQVRLTIPLKVGSITGQSVDIVDNPPLIDESPAVSTTIDRQFVANLPLNGRSFQALITLTPGVVLARTNGNNPGQFSVNGQRTNTNYFTVDGVSANIGIRATNTLSQTAGGAQPGLTAFGGTNNLVSVDALQEFKILTSTYAPEFGRTPGAQVSIVTRSGSNQFHGTGFEYFRNDKMDASDWFANANRTGKPPLRQNDFGGVLSGPVLLPRFGEGGRQPGYNGHNRTFFFFSYEGLRQRLPQVATVNVPSLTLRQSAPASLQPLLNAFPLPTGPENPTTRLAPLSSSFSNPSSLDAASIRIDHAVSDRVTLFGRYNYAPSETVQRGGTFALSTLGPTQIDTQMLTIGSTQTINSHISNEIRANWSRTTGNGFFFQDDFGGAVPPNDTQWFPPFATRQTDRIGLTLSFGISAGITVGNSAANQQRQINIVDSLSVVTGGHQFKFGVDYRRLSPVYGPQAYFQSLSFSSAAAVLAGTVSSLSITNNQRVVPIFTNFSAYAQDTWKVNQRLSFTYGMRYEVNPPPSEADGRQPFNIIGLDNPLTATLAAPGTPLYKATYNNFAPRIGVAYRLFQHPGRETVLRGGFGIFYDLGNGQAAQGFTSVPFVGIRTQANVPYPLSATAAAPASLAISPPFVSAVLIRAFDPSLNLPRTYQWNFALERSLGASQTLSASYVAAVGRRLLRSLRLVNPVPSLGNAFVDNTTNTGTSDYHAMQLQYNRRLSRRLQALASYTWSHSIDDASDEFFDTNLARAASDFDIRHAFNAAFTYDIPTPSTGKVGKAILRNFSIDAILTARSAAPVNVIARSNQTLTGQTQNIRPDLISGIPLYLKDPTVPGGRRFNPAAFSLPPTGRQGTLGRNALRGFPLSQLDLSLRRQFNLTERWNLQLRADLFNVLNHPNFGDPEFVPGNDLLYSTVLANGTPVLNPSFGISRFMYGRAIGRFGGGFSPLYQVGGPRSVQLSFKLQF